MANIKLKKATLTINKENGSTEEIDLSNAEIIKIEREKEPNNWHRQRFDRNKDGLVHPQIARDSYRIAISLANVNDDGRYIGKYDYWSLTLQPKPRPFQKRSGKRQKKQRDLYKQHLKEAIEKHNKGLEILKDKKVIVYLCFYLRKRKYEKSDLDNYVKLILDGLKPYMGDDSQITRLLLDKKQLFEDYDNADLDFLENTLVVVADEKAKGDLLKAIGSINH